MTKDTTTRIKDNGLRYASKVSGSPFSGRGQTRSCFKCGQHRSADQLQSQRLLGRVHMVCKPSCKALALAIAAGTLPQPEAAAALDVATALPDTPA
ncbi:hypothetical protein [Azohydromonas aeria]|uniref:hypothetical protein n=1 Tax=Azohydromonas aeria TaxID=2590212 RepID=UPI001E358863|nr:hypothetical protein [Azohydromonas aeria]